MNMKNILLLLVISCSLTGQAQTLVQNFTLTNVADGSSFSLEQNHPGTGLVLIFTSNTCPYDHYYTERLKSLIATYEEKIRFALINAYPDPEENAEKMKIAYGTWGVPVPYLADKEQAAMESLGARKSPEAFLLKHVNGKYSVVYRGAIDDSPQLVTGVKLYYLRAAIDQLLAGHKIELAAMRAVGCSIRWK